MSLTLLEKLTPAEREWCWWLDTKWLHHRHRIEDVHPLLVQIMQARGNGFMTIEHVLAVLDAKDPAALTAQWIGDRQPTSRTCEYPGCERRKHGRGNAAKYCKEHAALSTRAAHREAQRQYRKHQESSPSAAVLDALPGLTKTDS